jgi:hypothetical protein
VLSHVPPEAADRPAAADPARPARRAFCVAVVGARDLVSGERLSRLIQLLVTRHRDDCQILLVSVGRDGPELRPWAHDLGWTVLYEPRGVCRARRDYALAAFCDAVLVLGDERPWRRLLSLCRAAGTPTRVFRAPPRLPPVPPFAPDPGRPRLPG